MLSSQSKHGLALCLCHGISSLNVGRHRTIPLGTNRQDQWIVRRTYAQHRLVLPLLAYCPPTFCFAGRKGGEWKFIPDCLVLCSGLSPGSCLELRGDQWAWEIYCAGGIQSWCFKICMCFAVSHLLFCRWICCICQTLPGWPVVLFSHSVGCPCI